MYDASKTEPAYQLRYTWTGWPSKQRFEQTPTELLDDLKTLWETDGLRLLEQHWTDEQVQLLFSAKPHVSPEFLACRVKGRLDHAIRSAGLQMPLSRKLGVRSVGDNVTCEVESYIEGQVGRAQFVDDRFKSIMKEFTIVNDDVDLGQPSETKRGRYWYNLHIVLVTAERHRIVDTQRLATIRDWSIGIAAKKGHLISWLSVMPDHLHAAIRGNQTHSPDKIVSAFQNNLAFGLGQVRIWEDTYYAGTFSEYNIEAIRRTHQQRRAS
jgi:REP element-mobilizing transposase RayT